MRRTIANQFLASSRNRSLRTLQLLLFALGTLAIGYSAITLASAVLYQKRELRNFEATPPRNTQAVPVSTVALVPGSFDNPSLQLVANGKAFARLEIPRLHLADIIVEGDDEKDLRRAVGHIPQTALPGNPGNVALAGHRDTFFRPLEKIHRGDLITIRTGQDLYLYEVESTEIVSPQDSWVLSPTTDPSLTLVTCFPFRYIGSAPKRFVVHARQIAADTHAW